MTNFNETRESLLGLESKLSDLEIELKYKDNNSKQEKQLLSLTKRLLALSKTINILIED